MNTPRPPHRQPLPVCLVLLGGLLGTASRYAVTLALPSTAGRFPTATFVVNLFGAFTLGVVLAALERRGPDTGGRLRLRLLAGTGFLGAFTTYSTLAVDTDLLIRAHDVALAAGYALGSVALGLVATVAGLAVGNGRSTVGGQP